MSIIKRRGISVRVIILGLFGFAGLMFLLCTFFAKQQNDRFFETARPAQATIVDFNTTSDNSRYTIVAFPANGQTYRAKLSFYSSSMRIGEPIEIYYQPGNPLDIQSKTGTAFVFWIFGVLGSLFLLICIIGTVVSVRKNNSKAYLLRNGQAIRADITGVTENVNISFNERHPVVVRCRATLPDGTKTEFKSRNVWRSPEEVSALQSVKVYLDPANPKRYWVDVEGALDAEA